MRKTSLWWTTQQRRRVRKERAQKSIVLHHSPQASEHNAKAMTERYTTPTLRKLLLPVRPDSCISCALRLYEPKKRHYFQLPKKKMHAGMMITVAGCLRVQRASALVSVNMIYNTLAHDSYGFSMCVLQFIERWVSPSQWTTATHESFESPKRTMRHWRLSILLFRCFHFMNECTNKIMWVTHAKWHDAWIRSSVDGISAINECHQTRQMESWESTIVNYILTQWEIL